MTDEAIKSLQTAVLAAGLPNVYIGDLPQGKTECCALKVAHGYPSTQYFANKDILEPLVEVMVRNESYLTGSTDCVKAMNALNKFSDKSVGILQAQVVGSPGYLGRNPNGFGEWHFVVHITLTDY